MSVVDGLIRGCGVEHLVLESFHQGVGRIDRSKLGSIDFGIVGSGAMRPDSGAGRLLR